jgi:hypothetical protein
MEQGSAAWLAQRRGRVTASAVGAILGYSRRSRTQVAEVMRGERVDTIPQHASEWGHRFEADAVEAARQSIDAFAILEPAEGLVLHPTEPWLGASPDGICDGFHIEAKCPSGFPPKTPPRLYEAPKEEHILQVAVTWGVLYSAGFNVSKGSMYVVHVPEAAAEYGAMEHGSKVWHFTPEELGTLYNATLPHLRRFMAQWVMREVPARNTKQPLPLPSGRLIVDNVFLMGVKA